MNRNYYYCAFPLTGMLLFCNSVSAQQDRYTDSNSTNRVTLSLRFGLNIHAKFMGIGGNFGPGATPGFYDDGYVVTANPPNTSPNPSYTTYWGYDNVSQLVGSGPASYTGVALSHSTAVGFAPDASVGGNKPYAGFELSYDRELFVKEDWHDMRFGVEAALNYMNMSLKNSSAYNGVTVSTTTDIYGFPIAAAAPPFADSGLPGQQALHVPADSTGTVLSPGATFLAQDHFNADLWGGRLGPYVELPLSEKLNLRLSGGLAVGWLSGNDSWTQTLTPSEGNPITDSGGGHASKWLWGYFASLDATWQFNKRWAVDGAVQYQDLGRFDRTFQGREVQLDLSRSLFLEAGISYSF